MQTGQISCSLKLSIKKTLKKSARREEISEFIISSHVKGSHKYAPNCSCTHDQLSVFYSYSSFSIRNIYSLPVRVLLIGRTSIITVTRMVICADDWEFQSKKHLCECPDEWLFLGGSMLPITEKRDNLVLKAVCFLFIYLFQLFSIWMLQQIFSEILKALNISIRKRKMYRNLQSTVSEKKKPILSFETE